MMKFNIVDTLWDHIETPNLVSSYCGPSDDVERLAQLLRDIDALASILFGQQPCSELKLTLAHALDSSQQSQKQM